MQNGESPALPTPSEELAVLPKVSVRPSHSMLLATLRSLALLKGRLGLEKCPARHKMLYCCQKRGSEIVMYHYDSLARLLF